MVLTCFIFHHFLGMIEILTTIFLHWPQTNQFVYLDLTFAVLIYPTICCRQWFEPCLVSTMYYFFTPAGPECGDSYMFGSRFNKTALSPHLKSQIMFPSKLEDHPFLVFPNRNMKVKCHWEFWERWKLNISFTDPLRIYHTQSLSNKSHLCPGRHIDVDLQCVVVVGRPRGRWYGKIWEKEDPTAGVPFWIILPWFGLLVWDNKWKSEVKIPQRLEFPLKNFTHFLREMPHCLFKFGLLARGFSDENGPESQMWRYNGNQIVFHVRIISSHSVSAVIVAFSVETLCLSCYFSLLNTDQRWPASNPGFRWSHHRLRVPLWWVLSHLETSRNMVPISWKKIVKGSLEVLTSDYTESCRELLQRRCLTAEMFWRVGIARNAVFFRSFVASKARKGRSEKRELRRIGCPRCRQNLHHACARERFGSRNR